MKQALISKLIADNIGANDICKSCRQQNGMNTNALTPYIIADTGTLQEKRIMFVGKAARGDGIGNPINMDYEDVTDFGKKYLNESSWAYYSYTKEIVESYYVDLESALGHISFTNMVKCNNESMQDSTPNDAKICCIDKNRFIWKEIEIIKPKRIVFYTHSYYDEFIEKFAPENCERIQDITDKSFRISIGRKTSLFWHRAFYDKNGNQICSFLRTSHPMMKNREDFIKSILDWLRATDIN